MRASASLAQTCALEKTSTVPATAELLRNCLLFTATPFPCTRKLRKYLGAHDQAIPLDLHRRQVAGHQRAHHPKVNSLPVYTPELCEVLTQNRERRPQLSLFFAVSTNGPA